jgi:hypothetical protein
VEHGSVDRGLQVAAEDDVPEEEPELPLILLVASRGSEGQVRLAVAKSE